MNEDEARTICRGVLAVIKVRRGDTEAVLREVSRRCEQDRTVREAFVMVGMAAVNAKQNH